MMEERIEDIIRKSKITLQVMNSKESLYYRFARMIADEIKENNAQNKVTRLILPVGPKLHYPILKEITNKERISWRNVFVFGMDEYLDWQGRPIPEDHPLSFKGFMHRFFSGIDKELSIPQDQLLFPDVYNIDAVSEKIRNVGGIDTCYGGIGVHGHIAFNEPPISRFYEVTLEEFANSKTRVVPLAPETIVMNSIRANGGNFANFPSMSVTLGMKDILDSRRIRLFCDGGEWQKKALREALVGKKRVEYPVTLIQGHQDAIIFADKETVEPVSVK